MSNLLSPSLPSNDSSRAGQRVPGVRPVLAGEFSRFQLIAVFTRFDYIAWAVYDAEGVPQEGERAELIGVLPSFEEAVACCEKRA